MTDHAKKPGTDTPAEDALDRDRTATLIHDLAIQPPAKPIADVKAASMVFAANKAAADAQRRKKAGAKG